MFRWLFCLGPAPKETLAILKSLDNCIFIRGNHDRYLIEKLWEKEMPSLEGMDPYDPINQAIVANEKWTAEQLGKEGVDFVLDMHVAHREVINSILIEFTHAWYQRDDQPPSIMEIKNWKNHVQNSHPEVEKFVFIHGHIHTPRFEEEENISIYCQGATGLPFDEKPQGAVAFLTVGETAGESFMNMYYAVRMCEVAVKAQGSGLKLETASKELWEKSQKQYDAFSPGPNEWPALLRRCDVTDPTYKE